MKIQTSYLDALAQAIVDDLAAGKICFYTADQPADPATAISTQTLLAELTMPSPAGAVSDGVITFGTITSDTSANATGVAAWARFLKADGSTAVFDAPVGTGLDIDGIGEITVGQTVAIDALVLIVEDV